MKELTPYHRCPNCGGSKYGPFKYLDVYPSIEQEEELRKDGITNFKYKMIAKSSPDDNGCCDFGYKKNSREEVNIDINKYSNMEDVFHDFYYPYDDSFDDYFEQGPVDSDPYDWDGPIF